jgi:N-6 DNA Methylase
MPFMSVPDKETCAMLTTALDAIPAHGQGDWAGWSGAEYFRFFLQWLLHGFGHGGHREPPPEPPHCQGAGARLARVFNLPLWQQHPYDYLGDLLAQNAYGKQSGFFPTPHTVAEFMAQMTLGVRDGSDKTDRRILTVCDPCVGTGRLLLHASNYSLRLYGLDIEATLCLATLVNGFLFAPWLVRPLPYLDGVQYQPEHSSDLSAAMAAQAPPHQAARLIDTEHDVAEQWRVEPIKKRVKRRDSNPSSRSEGQQELPF